MRRFFKSLLAKYMLIIFMALFLIQSAYLLLATFITIGENIQKSEEEEFHPTVIEERWHADARQIQNSSEIDGLFEGWKREFPDATMFWIDETGSLEKQLDVKKQLPSKWTPSFTAKFIKERYGGDPFTVIAFVGENENQGFVVLEIPRAAFTAPVIEAYDNYGAILLVGFFAIIILFVGISFLFFRGIRNRLLQLQNAMELRDMDGLPIDVLVKKDDEIGQLEQTFNGMVTELRESKKREQEEEQIRRELIANLSHDLRTPLTKIRAQTYSIIKEDLSTEGQAAVKALESSIVNIDSLIENLMSYTLLTAKKYKFEPKATDVIRFVRESLASWYPVFEKEGFDTEIELDNFTEKNWMVDPIWFGRILDNLFQNILRHANDGKYIKVSTESNEEHDIIIISDRGKGLKNESTEKGAGIGLSIVDMMVKNMNLDWDIQSDSNGTTIRILKHK
ncbi:sensor histidine kinase [Fredinandcohnia sp. 179-A 10B2 NHS]|uniref:sensor histidine kinase n=1 Tax=Fredinandcohnia sp. 179-A 10B2 NHS TaxID=3235176 RepID=UPI0039A08FD3